MTASKSTANNARTARKSFYTVFEIVETPDGYYKASQPETDGDNWGRGESESEAIQNYLTLVTGDSA